MNSQCVSDVWGFALICLFLLLLFHSRPAHAAESQEPATVQVHLKNPLGPINPLIFGHFTELTLNCYESGVWGEMLVNRKFGEMEEVDKFPIVRSGTGACWEPILFDWSVSLHMDNLVRYSAPYSQRITLSEGGKGPAGIQQSGYQNRRVRYPFHFKTTDRYRVRIVARQKEPIGPAVIVALGASPDDAVAEHAFELNEKGWNAYECVLTPSHDVEDGKFMVYIESPGTVWIDSVSMMDDRLTQDGFRRDAIELTRNITPTSLRFPGGCFADDYRWKDGIGPMDKRPDVLNRAWNRYIGNEVGTDEFIALCQMVGAEPYICVNYGTATPKEAAEWVEYCNGGPDTKWGKARAENGHPAPYRVKYWNIGNEIYLPTELGATNAREYGKGFREFAKAMRKVDPTIELVAVGCFGLSEDFQMASVSEERVRRIVRYWKNWVKELMAEAGDEVDHLSIHYYEPEQVKEAETFEDVDRLTVAVSEDLDKRLTRLREELTWYAPAGKHIPIALDEWATWTRGGPEPPARDYAPKNVESHLQLGLYGALVPFRQALGEACILNLVQRRASEFSIGSKTIIYAYMIGEIGIRRDAVVLGSDGLMMGLYATHDTCQSLQAEALSDTFTVKPLGPRFRDLGEIKFLDVSARMHPDKKNVDVFVVNRNLTDAIPCTLSFADGAVAPGGTVATLNAEDVHDWNSFDNPDRIQVKTTRLGAGGSNIDYAFPAHSITKFTVEVSGYAGSY